MLAALLRGMALVGALAAAFGPCYAYAVLRLAYGQRWSSTAAPVVLAAYSLYIPVLAVNGILEVRCAGQPAIACACRSPVTVFYWFSCQLCDTRSGACQCRHSYTLWRTANSCLESMRLFSGLLLSMRQ